MSNEQLAMSYELKTAPPMLPSTPRFHTQRPRRGAPLHAGGRERQPCYYQSANDLGVGGGSPFALSSSLIAHHSLPVSEAQL